MQPATIVKTQTKVRRTSVAKIKTARQQTFKEWLAEEAAAGRMILATANGKPKLPTKPRETIDFWAAYNETRADRF
jgi:hypothetical protein